MDFNEWTKVNKSKLDEERRAKQIMGRDPLQPSGEDKLGALYRAVLDNEERDKQRAAATGANKLKFQSQLNQSLLNEPVNNIRSGSAYQSYDDFSKARSLSSNGLRIRNMSSSALSLLRDPNMREIADRSSKIRELEAEAEKYNSYRRDSYNNGKSYVMSNNPDADLFKRSSLLEEADSLKSQNTRAIYENMAKSDPNKASYITVGYPKAEYFNSDKLRHVKEGKLSLETSGVSGIYGTTSKVNYDKLHYLDGDHMTREEKDTYEYLLGKGKTDEAKKYLKAIASDVNARSSADMQQDVSSTIRRMRDEHPIVGTIAGVATNAGISYATPMSYFDALTSKLTGKAYDPNSSLNIGTMATSVTQEGLTGDIKNPFGKFLADVGISTAQYLSKLPLGPAAALTVMASGAAGQTAYEAKQNGADTDSALLLGTIAGAAEAITEKIPLESVASAFSNKFGKTKAAQAVAKLLKTELHPVFNHIIATAGEEGAEEWISEVINNVANQIIRGDESDYSQLVSEYVSQGMSESEAKKKAFQQYYIMNPFIAFLGGAVSGGGMAALGHAANNPTAVVKAITGDSDYMHGYIKDAMKTSSANTVPANEKSAADNGVKYSISYDKANTPYVVVNKDVLADIPKSQWRSEIKKYIPTMSAVEVGNETIGINAKTKKEYIYSKYSQRVNDLDSLKYKDKLNALQNIDEIIKATRDYVNEAPAHPRKDSFVDFARGKVNLSVGGNEYRADVVCGYTSNGNTYLYDVINLEPISINKRPDKSQASHTNQSNDSNPHRLLSAVNNSISSSDTNVNEQNVNNPSSQSESRKAEQFSASNITYDNSVKYSIRYDKTNTPYVVVDKDVLADIPKSQWRSEIKNYIPTVTSVQVGNQTIGINAKTKSEYLYSKNSKKAYANIPNIFRDKLNAMQNIDEIIKATRNYVNEAPAHPREDNFVQFARGSVNLRVGNNEYKADVVCGYTSGGRTYLYDVINLEKISINKKPHNSEGKNIYQFNDSKRPSASYATGNSISNTTPNVNEQNVNNPSSQSESRKAVQFYASNITSDNGRAQAMGRPYGTIRASNASNDTARTGWLSGAKQADIEMAELISKAFGRNIIFKSDNYHINGKFADGTIYVNPDGSDLVSTTIAHELTHSIEYSSEGDGYSELVIAAKQLVSARGESWDDLLSAVYKEYSRFYKLQNRDMSRAEAESEVVARTVSSLFSDNASLEAFARSNRNIAVRMWNRLKSLVSKLADAVKAAVSGSRVRTQGEAALAEAERLRDIFAKALIKSKREFEDGNKVNMRNQEPDKHSFSDIRIPSYDELIRKPDMKVVDIRSERDVRSFREQRKELMQSDIASDLYKSPVINYDTGESVFITPKTFEHSLFGYGYDKINSAKNIRSIIENAVLTHGEKSTHGADSTSGVYTLFAAVRTDAGIAPVKVKIKEYIIGAERLPTTISEYLDAHKTGSKYYSSVYDSRVLEVESIKKGSVSGFASAAQSTSELSARDPSTLPLAAMNLSSLRSKDVSGLASAAQSTSGSSARDPSTLSKISISHLLGLVNSEYQKYLPNKNKSDVTQASHASAIADPATERPKRSFLLHHSDDSISPSASRVNERNVNIDDKDTHHSYTEQYGTKPINEAEALLREKAIDMQQHGYEPVEIYDKTGWFYDKFGNFKVNHEADIYLYGSNETGNVIKLRSELDSVKAAHKKELEKATQKARVEAAKRFKRDLRNNFKKSAEYKPSRDFVKSLADEIMGDDFSNKYKGEIVDRLLKAYDDVRDLNIKDSNVLKDFSNELSDIVNDIQASHTVVNEENTELVKNLKPDLRKPIYVTENARNDFHGKWGNVRKQYFGKLRLTTDKSKGVSVDVRYMELADAYPDWFSDDIINEGEQLKRIMEVYDTITAPEFTLDSYYDIDHGDDAAAYDHEKMLTRLLGGYKEMQEIPRTWYDKALRDLEYSKRANEREYQAKLEEIEEAAKQECARQAAEEEKKIKEIENRKRQRGEFIDVDKIRQSKNDNTYTQKMKKLYERKQELSEYVSRYEKVDIDNIKDKGLREEILKKREELVNLNIYIRRANRASRKLKQDKWHFSIINHGDPSKWKDKSKGILYSRETPRRNIRDVFGGDELGQKIEAEVIDKLEHDTALAAKFQNEYKRQVGELGIGQKKVGRNKLSESVFIQEYCTTKDNVYMLENDLGYSEVNDNGERVRRGRTLEEHRDHLNTLILENPDMNIERVEELGKKISSIYDGLLEMVNNARIENGYEPIQYHHGYFPEFNDNTDSVVTEGGSVIAQMLNGLGLGAADDVLPTTINGLTKTFRPGIRYMANANQRSQQSKGHSIGVLEGFEKYIETAADVIFLTEDIQEMRALSDEIRYITSDKGIQKTVDEIRKRFKNNEISGEEMETLIAKLYDENHQHNHYMLSNFVVWWEELTNIIANKKSMKDRQWEQAMGRRFYTFVKKVESRVAANMVGGNIGSALTNFVPLTQAAAVIHPKYMFSAIGKTIAAKCNHGDSDFWMRSDFLVNRFGVEKLVQSKLDKVSNVFSYPMDAIDKFTSETIVRAMYDQNLGRGLSDADALHEADVFAEGLMAGRSKGAMPTLFYQANPLVKVFTMFQLEANNQFSFMLKDLPREAKENFKKLVGMLFGLMVYSWMYNELYEQIVGRRAAFDPLDMLNNLAGDLTGYHIPGLADIIECIGEEKEWSDIAKTDKQKLPTAIKNFAGDAIEQVPFIGGLVGGGRLPINSAIPSPSNIVDALDFSGYGKIDDEYNSIIEEKYSDGSEESNAKAEELRAEAEQKKQNLTKSKLLKIGGEIAKPAVYVLPPFGGGQLKKTAEGIAGLISGGSYTYDSSGNKKLQYPIDNSDPGDIAKAVVFGKTATKGGREWVKSGFKSQSAKATKAYESLVEAGVGKQEALSAVQSIQSVGGRVNKVKTLRGIDMSDTAKVTAFRQLINDDYEEKLERVSKAKISFDDFLAAYEMYLSKTLDAGEGVSRRNSVEAVINGLKLDNSQKDVLLGLFYNAGIAFSPWNDPFHRKLQSIGMR
ncbi:MAG: hypothetical protein HFE63_01300 [Clostridiales bacterium]|nr:hypothetical protein [Clostridiales bacterium]